MLVVLAYCCLMRKEPYFLENYKQNTVIESESLCQQSTITKIVNFVCEVHTKNNLEDILSWKCNLVR